MKVVETKDNMIITFIKRHTGTGTKRLTFGFALMFLLLWLLANTACAQEIHGTLRGKYELQTEDMEQRFEVRTARVSFTGELSPIVSYKAEIDLCDEGKIKMLDAYTKISLPNSGRAGVGLLSFQIGQMRVPFTIDAHRSPHQQYFANRSFIAKQVGNVRDVGAQVAYSFGKELPVTITAGLFNGSGLTDQKDYWTKDINFSGKMQFTLPGNLNLLLSAQQIKPDGTSILMYDSGLNYHAHGLHIEGEYLLKTYANGEFANVHAVDAFAAYDIPLRQNRKAQNGIKKITPLIRYDFMTDHSDGKHDDNGHLKINDYKRNRITSGVTLSLNKPFVTDIRINYEKYFYGDNAKPKPSERDKLVVEFMTRF